MEKNVFMLFDFQMNDWKPDKDKAKKKAPDRNLDGYIE